VPSNCKCGRNIIHDFITINLDKWLKCTWICCSQSNMDFSAFLPSYEGVLSQYSVSQRKFLDKGTLFPRLARPPPSVTDSKWDAIRWNPGCLLRNMNNWNLSHTYLFFSLCLSVSHQWLPLQTFAYDSNELFDFHFNPFVSIYKKILLCLFLSNIKFLFILTRKSLLS
jgi:hypothetical protein